MKKAIVIGAGIGGLASALRLRKKGFDVDVFESNDYPGGKLSSFTEKGFRFDAGPSLFTKPEFVIELFELFGVDPKKYFSFHRKETVCNYFWEDGIRLSVPADIEKFAERASSLFSVDSKVIRDYLRASQMKYELTAPLFLEKSLHKLRTYLSAQTVRALFRSGSLDLFRDLNTTNKKTLKEPHLVQMFNRYATYNGSSPFKTPGIMSMIPHLELHDGTYFPVGGMVSITNGLFKLAQDQGIRFHLSEPIFNINVNGKKVESIDSAKGSYHADYYIVNSDIYSAYKKLMPVVKQPEKVLNQERSSSAIIFYWGINKTFDELDLHNIFFSNDYEEEFKYLFDKKSLYKDLTVYVNITSKEEKADAPDGCENWFVMVNAPGDFGQDWDKLIHEARKNILNKLNTVLGGDVQNHIVAESIMDPRIIEKRTNSHSGSLYGTSSNSRYAAFLRHPNFSSTYKNMFFVGGSVHPGGGIPLCLMSAKIATELIPNT